MDARTYHPRLTRQALLVALCVGALLSGCAVGPDFERPATLKDDRYTSEAAAPATIAADDLSQGFHTDQALQADWWRLFQSPALNDAVQQALEHNPSMEASNATLRQSQDALRAGSGIFFPQVDVGLSGKRERSSTAAQGIATPGSIYNVVTLGANISYAIDVFGGQRRTVEALRAQSEVQQNLNRAARLTLTANVVNTAIARAAYLAQTKATEQLLVLQQQQLNLLQIQFQTGSTPYTAILNLKSAMSANHSALAALEQRRAQTEHLLASLLGGTPASTRLPDLNLLSLTLPQDLPVSLPSDLAHQRPDILASEAQMHAANAEIGVATAAMFPSINLGAGYGSAGSSFGALDGDNAKFWNIGPSIDIPIFRGGSLWYGRQAAIDAWQAAQGNYRQTVLNAFAQVADALNALEHDAEGLAAQVENKRATSETLEIVHANYQSGIAAYSDVLAADIASHQAVVAYLQSLAQRQQDTVGLFAALGGGWWNDTTTSANKQGATR